MVPLSCADGRGALEVPVAARWTHGYEALKCAGAAPASAFGYKPAVLAGACEGYHSDGTPT